MADDRELGLELEDGDFVAFELDDGYLELLAALF